jgi:hypothetical protein
MKNFDSRLRRMEEALSVKPGTFRCFTKLELAVRLHNLLSTGKAPEGVLEILKGAEARREAKERRIHNDN